MYQEYPEYILVGFCSGIHFCCGVIQAITKPEVVTCWFFCMNLWKDWTIAPWCSMDALRSLPRIVFTLHPCCIIILLYRKICVGFLILAGGLWGSSRDLRPAGRVTACFGVTDDVWFIHGHILQQTYTSFVFETISCQCTFQEPELEVSTIYKSIRPI